MHCVAVLRTLYMIDQATWCRQQLVFHFIALAAASPLLRIACMPDANRVCVCCLCAGVVNGVQGSLQSAFEIASFVMGILVPQPQHFHWLMLASVAAVAAATAVYAKHLVAVRASPHVALHPANNMDSSSRAVSLVADVEQCSVDGGQAEEADGKARTAGRAHKGEQQQGQQQDTTGGGQG